MTPCTHTHTLLLLDGACLSVRTYVRVYVRLSGMSVGWTSKTLNLILVRLPCRKSRVWF